MGADRVEEALGRIAAADGVERLKRAFVEIAPEVIDAGVYGIYTLQEGARTSSVRAAHEPAGFVDAYERLGRPNDTLFRYIATHGRPIHDRILFARRPWLREPVGRFLDDWGLSHVIQAPVCLAGTLEATLHFGRGKPGRPFGDRDLEVAALIGRQVGQQLRWIHTEHELRAMRGLCSSLLEGNEIPAVVTKASGELVEANEAGRTVLLSYRERPALWEEFAAAVRRNVEALEGEGSGVRASCRRGPEGPRFTVSTTPVQGGDLMLSLFQPSVGAKRDHSALAAREQVVASLVAAGHTNERIALLLDLSVNTIKDHLKRINRKLGTANRAQLAAWAQRNLSPGE
jgi:DNA-binding CsgD family transcriptional regulator